MAKSKHGDKPIDPLDWADVVSYQLAHSKRAEAQAYLDSVIQGEDMALFHDSEALRERARLAWIYKINLLRSWGRQMEALAWVCLECELNPTNVAAAAMKVRLKRELQLLPAQMNREAGDFSTPGKSGRIRWDGVAGMRELKAMLERDVILPLLEPDVYERYGVDVPNGVLLYGPPGCGKTFIARKLAKLIGFHFIEIKPSDLGSIYVHGTQGKIGELFQTAEEQAPCMLFFDELDAMVPSRADVHQAYAGEVNEFLVQLNNCSKRRLLVVGATNFVERIDPAVCRPGRLDKHVLIGPPDYEARVELFRMQLGSRPQEKIELQALAKASEGHSCAEIEFVVDEAARAALVDRRPITTDDLIAALKANPSRLQQKPQPGARIGFNA